MNQKAKGWMVAILAVSAAVVALYFAFAERSPKINLDTYEVLGTVTAEETAKLLGDKGVVLVMVRDTGADKNPSVEAQLKAFQQELKKHSGLRVITERVPVTPMTMMATGGGVPREQLFKALQTHAPVGAVVLFFGFPQLSESDLATLKKTGAQVVVVSSLRPAYERLLAQQVIHRAIVRRPDAEPATDRKARTARELFDQDYLILSADGAAGPR
jgi:hypothetical protein